MSTFGRIFRVSTFGESHCAGVGAIIDGCPPGLEITEADVQPQLTRRRPGHSSLTTPRDEKDMVTLLSGTEFGRTLGTPIGLFVANLNVRKKDYSSLTVAPRPGHADYTYQMKYGTRASSGGGRSSARETIGRVAAGAVAEKWLRQTYGTEIVSWVHSIGDVTLPAEHVRRPDGGPWTRAQVDANGQLQVLRDPAMRATVPAEASGEALSGEAADAAFREHTEAAFIASTDASIPAYFAMVDGTVLGRDGDVIVSLVGEALEAWKTDELVALRCPHAATAAKMATVIREVKRAKDSIGCVQAKAKQASSKRWSLCSHHSTSCLPHTALLLPLPLTLPSSLPPSCLRDSGVVTGYVTGVPVGLGEPCFDKLEAKLAHAMMSLPATKGFEIGSGFDGARMRGSAHNDLFAATAAGESADVGGGTLRVLSNHAGGTLGGISSGAPIYFRVAVKPVSTIGQAQLTAEWDGSAHTMEAKGRHDPCVLPRTPPLIEAMAALVLIDAALIQRTRAGPSTDAAATVGATVDVPLAARVGAAPTDGSAVMNETRTLGDRDREIAELRARLDAAGL